MEFAAEAIRGHRSAHSFATGPVIADPAYTQQGKQSAKEFAQLSSNTRESSNHQDHYLAAQ